MAEERSTLFLKIIVLTQWVLSVWAAMSPFFLTTSGYIYMNIFILALGIWAIAYNESTDAVLMYLLANLLSIILDIIFVSIYQPRSGAEYSGNRSVIDEYRFSLGMFITLLILKPVACLILFRIYTERGGTTGELKIPGIPNFSVPSNTQYENLDKPSPSSQPVETATPHQSLETSQTPRY